jgi:hypothetical protein
MVAICEPLTATLKAQTELDLLHYNVHQHGTAAPAERWLGVLSFLLAACAGMTLVLVLA